MDRQDSPRDTHSQPGPSQRSFSGLQWLLTGVARSFKKDLLLKLIAFALALTLWAMVSEEPDVEGTFTLPVDVSLPEHLVLTTPSTQSITVYLKASRSRLKSIPIRELELPLDLTEARAGETVLRLDNARIRNLPGGITVMGFSPSSLTFQLDVREYKTVPVVVKREGQLPAGKKLRELKVKPETVALEGPRSVLQSIQELTTRSLSLSSITQSETRLLELEIGNQLVRTRNGQDRVQVTIALDELLVQKRISGLRVHLADALRKYIPDPAEVSLVVEGLPQQIEQVDPAEILVHARPGDSEALHAGETLLLRLAREVPPPARPHVFVELPEGSGLKLVRMSPAAVELHSTTHAPDAKSGSRPAKDRPKR